MKTYKKEMVFRKENGDLLRGILFLPGAGHREAPFPLVIIAHGLGASWKDLEHHGGPIAEEGIACLLFDFRGGSSQSESGGSMADMSVLTEVEDLDFILDKVLGEAAEAVLPEIDRQKVFLLGESQGGLVSALCAAKRPSQIRGLLLWYPAFSIPETCRALLRENRAPKELFGFPLGERYFRDAAALDADQICLACQGPVFLIHGEKDPLVPVSWSRKAARLCKNSRLEIIPGAGHDFEGKDSVHAREASVRFIKDCL